MNSKILLRTLFHRPHLVAVVLSGGLGLNSLALAQDSAFSLDAPRRPAPDPAKVRALTQVSSHAELGVGYVSDDSFKFGKYTGLEEEGVFGVLELDYRRQTPYDAPRHSFFRLRAMDLGLRSRSIHAEQTSQGNYSLFLNYDQIPTFRSDSSATVFRGGGTTVLDLPGTWVAGTNTAGMTQLLPSLERFDVEHERQRLGIGVSKPLVPGWNFSTRYQHETKEGLKVVGAIIGNTGGNPRAALVPEPIDYTTQEFVAALDYSSRRSQLQASYQLSLFSNENQSLSWRNPYATIGGWDASVGHPSGFGRLHLPPDNQYHQLGLQGGINLGADTRLSADAAYGLLLQDEDFLPYTVNPTLAATITQPLPRSSLDGRIQTILLNVRLSTRFNDRLAVKTGYRFDDRDNKTPRDEYVYIAGDSQTQDTAVDSSRRRFNEPYSFREHKVYADGNLRATTRTHVQAGIEHSNIERSFTERESTRENTLKLGTRTRWAETLSGGVKLSLADRTGSTYRGEGPFLSGYSPGYTSTVPGEWENHPDLRKYNLADRIRGKGAFYLSYSPITPLNLGLNASYHKDQYNESEFGLTQSKSRRIGIDSSLIVSETQSTYAFVQFEDLRSDQDGRAFLGFGAKLGQAADPSRDWFAAHEDQITTLGIGYQQTLIRNKLEVNVDYVYARAEGKVNVGAREALTVAELPDSITRLNSFRITGKYKLREELTFILRYWAERYDTRDWALDDVEPNTLANIITLGEDSPTYRVHVITLSLRYRF